MRRIRGKKQDELTLIQFCNDWFMAESATRPNIIVRPTQVELDDEEMQRIRCKANTGTLWREFEAYEHAPGAWRFRQVS